MNRVGGELGSVGVRQGGVFGEIAAEKKIKHRIAQRYGISDPQFERAMSQLLGPPILGGNEVTPLHNGVEIFPAMLDAIGKAERTITFETFVYWSGDIADRFAEALAAKALEGVKVHVLIDGFGCDCTDGLAMRRMEEAGVELELYHLTSFARTNHRTHRKLLVIDGKVGFTGGVGISDLWDGDADSPEHYRDTHYRVEGPVVALMQAAFLDNWMKTRAVERGVSVEVLLPGPNQDSLLVRAASRHHWGPLLKGG